MRSTVGCWSHGDTVAVIVSARWRSERNGNGDANADERLGPYERVGERSVIAVTLWYELLKKGWLVWRVGHDACDRLAIEAGMLGTVEC